MSSVSNPPISAQSLTQNYPSSQCGYLLWVPPGGGPTQLLDVSMAGQMVLGTKGRMHQIGFSFVGGVLPASQILGLHRFSINVTFPPNFGPYQSQYSTAGGTANATGSTVITINKAAKATPVTFSSVGTITFASSSVTPTFATTGAVSFVEGDVIQLVGPGSADATFSNFYCSLVGYEG